MQERERGFETHKSGCFDCNEDIQCTSRFLDRCFSTLSCHTSSDCIPLLAGSSGHPTPACVDRSAEGTCPGLPATSKRNISWIASPAPALGRFYLPSCFSTDPPLINVNQLGSQPNPFGRAQLCWKTWLVCKAAVPEPSLAGCLSLTLVGPDAGELWSIPEWGDEGRGGWKPCCKTV